MKSDLREVGIKVVFGGVDEPWSRERRCRVNLGWEVAQLMVWGLKSLWLGEGAPLGLFGGLVGETSVGASSLREAKPRGAWLGGNSAGSSWVNPVTTTERPPQKNQ